MNTFKAILQYDGTDRAGFQRQEGYSTIQADLEESLKKLLECSISTRAASRTDKGVHAFAQVVKISTEEATTLTSFQLNEALPSHIRCLEISPCPTDFIPSIDQRSKEYRYLFLTSQDLHLDHRYLATPPRTLNIEAMQSCVAILKGTHDFKNFWSIGGISNSTIRDIHECDLSLINPQELFRGSIFSAGDVSSCWQFRIQGSGFLKHMVRHLVGALWLVGDGRLSPEDFAHYLHGEQKSQRPWKKADPRGLYLMKVSY
jgi:tRNA pseudouridine38-40 synthase